MDVSKELMVIERLSGYPLLLMAFSLVLMINMSLILFEEQVTGKVIGAVLMKASIGVLVFLYTNSLLYLFLVQFATPHTITTLLKEINSMLKSLSSKFTSNKDESRKETNRSQGGENA